MSSFSAPSQLSMYSSPSPSIFTVVVHFRNLSDCGFAFAEYWTDIRARFLLILWVTLMGFLKRSFSTTTNVNAPFLVKSVAISLTKLFMASTGSKTQRKTTIICRWHFWEEESQSKTGMWPCNLRVRAGFSTKDSMPLSLLCDSNSALFLSKDL